jgi:hypothetical protein
VKWVKRLVLAAGLLLAVSGAVLAFALQPGQPVDWTALGLIILIVGLAVLSGAVVSPRNAPNDPALRTDRLIGLVQTSGGALTVALAMTFTVVVALVAIPLAAGPDRATVATAAFTGVGTIAGAYFGLRVGAEGTEQAERDRQEAQLALERVADKSEVQSGAVREAREEVRHEQKKESKAKRP